MGRDIHVRIECKVKGKGNQYKWYDCTPKYLNPFFGIEGEPKYESLCEFGRNYEAFELLQGKYNGISNNGCPEDLSELVGQELKNAGSNIYGIGHFTLLELKYFCLTSTEQIAFDDDEKPLTAKDVLKQYIEIMQIVYNASTAKNENCVRMVFWFDC